MKRNNPRRSILIHRMYLKNMCAAKAAEREVKGSKDYQQFELKYFKRQNNE